MMALAMGLMLFSAMQGVARNLPPKEVMEKVQAIQAHLSEKNPEVKVIQSYSPSLSISHSAPKNDEEFVTIKCKFMWDDEEMPYIRPIYASVQSTDWEYYTTASCLGNTEVDVNAPKGKECFVYGLFNDIYAPTIIVKTVIANENTEVVINAADADQEISFQPITPNGEILSVDVIGYDEDYNEIVIEPGTVSKAFYQLSIFAKNSPALAIMSGNYFRMLIGDGEIFDLMDYLTIKTNNNDCIYVYNIVSAMNEKDGAMVIKLGAKGNLTQTVSNSVDDYLAIESRYGKSLWEAPTTNDYMIGVDPSKNCGIGTSYNWLLSDAQGVGYAAVCGTDVYPTDLLHLNIPSPRANDYLEVVGNPVKIFYTEINERFQQSSYGIGAPSIMMINSNPMMLATNNFVLETRNAWVANLLRNKPDFREYAYNPWFSYPLSNNQNEIYGGNVPITRFSYGANNQISYSFVGRYSESRSIDFMNHKVCFYYNNDLIAETWKELQALPQTWWDNPIEPGNFKLEIENANMMVEGIQGRNTFVTEYDNNVENFSFPVMEILQFRNTNNEVTDRFENAADGVLSFAAGSFIYTPNDYYPYYEYEPLNDIKVDYAPNGTDFYQELEIEEDPEKFYMPGYGAYYYASLNQVDNMSENGWYDMRITLTGSNGAYQQQTVSPAFKINKNTGIPLISNIGSTLSEVRINGRNIIAPEDAVIVNASGLTTSRQNVIPGVYIVHLSNGYTQKVIVK